MKTLLLVRHAKSSWDDSTLADRDRPLEARGERDVARMRKRLAQGHDKPDLIISSPAVRALATARGLAEGVDHRPGSIVVDDRLYGTTVAALMARVEALDDEFNCVMLVGHNPEFTELAHHFCSGITHMPTCAIVVFAFDTGTWTGIGRVKPVKTHFDAPKSSSG